MFKSCLKSPRKKKFFFSLIFFSFLRYPLKVFLPPLLKVGCPIFYRVPNARKSKGSFTFLFGNDLKQQKLSLSGSDFSTVPSNVLPYPKCLVCCHKLCPPLKLLESLLTVGISSKSGGGWHSGSTQGVRPKLRTQNIFLKKKS